MQDLEAEQEPDVEPPAEEADRPIEPEREHPDTQAAEPQPPAASTTCSPSRASSRRCCSSPATRSAWLTWPRPRRRRAADRAGDPVLEEQLEPGRRGLQLRQIGGGYLLASAPEAEDAARRLFSRPRVATLTPAQTETLAIVAYLQPISSARDRAHQRRERRLRGRRSARARLDRRGRPLAVRRRPLPHYDDVPEALRPASIKELPDIAQWDPSPEEQSDLRDRLLRAGEARASGGPCGD